jgi:hypothetical protein
MLSCEIHALMPAIPSVGAVHLHAMHLLEYPAYQIIQVPLVLEERSEYIVRIEIILRMKPL